MCGVILELLVLALGDRLGLVETKVGRESR